MRTFLASLMLLSGITLVAAPSPCAAGKVGADDVERFRSAATEHPDDPDLAWALAMALRAHGSRGEAIAKLREISEHFPRRRTRAYFSIARIYYDSGWYERALELFELVIDLDPMHGAARLQRGLCLKELGRPREAEQELRVVARIEPELRAETLLVRGMLWMDAGNEQQARGLLEEAIALDPDGDVAQRAYQAMQRRRKAVAGAPRASVWVTSGVDLDSNVTLDSGTALFGISSDDSDTTAVWGGRALFNPVRGDWGTLSVGYAYTESAHENLKAYDQQTHTVLSMLSVRGPANIGFRFDAFGTDAHLDQDRYLRSWKVRPNLFVPTFGSGGLSRLFFEAGRTGYHDRPTFSSLDRSGATYRAGLEQYLPVVGWKGALASLGGTLGRRNTEATTDLLGFSGDYDNRQATITGRIFLPFRDWFDLTATGGLAWDRYVNRNLVDALTDEGIGTADPSRRRDNILRGMISIRVPVGRGLRAELRWTGERHRSNVDVYDYERHIVGVHLTGNWSWR
jgi:tetratricopeptide (TPR) repeat protein